MNSKFEQYLQQQLGTTGFAILDPELAYQLRPDIFGTPGNCQHAYSESLPSLDSYLQRSGVALFVARLELADQRFFLAARSTDQLAQRVQWMTGRNVAEILPARSVLTAPAAVPRQAVQLEEIPSWPCQARSDALAAAGRREDKFREQRSGKSMG